MSDRDEIIVDILEKVADKVDNISAEQIRQSVILEFNTQVLKEHERRSTASEDRLVLLEKDAQFFRNFIVIITALGGLVTLVVKIFPNFHL